MTVVTGWDLLVGPSFAFGSVAEGAEDRPGGVFLGGARNERSIQLARRIVGEADRFLKTTQAEVRHARSHEITLGTGFQTPHIKMRFAGGKAPAFSRAFCRLPEHLSDGRGQEIERRLSVGRYECIDVNETIQAIGE